MNRTLIVGASGHAQVIADLILNCARAGAAIDLVGFVDDNASLIGKQILGVPVLGALADIDRFTHDAVVIGIGDNATRARVFQHLRQRQRMLPRLIHPRATVAVDVQIDDGSVVFAGAVINTGSSIGANVIVNTGATIDHHARIGAYVHIAPGVHLGGAVTVGEGAFIGIGSSIMPNRVIGAWSTVGAGAAVIHDLPEGVTAVGIPARIVKRHIAAG